MEEPGDFDHTPAPSNRSSLVLRRSSEDANFSSKSSAPTAAAPPRHHLLKLSLSGPTITESHLSAPPLITQPLTATDAPAKLPRLDAVSDSRLRLASSQLSDLASTSLTNHLKSPPLRGIVDQGGKHRDGNHSTLPLSPPLTDEPEIHCSASKDCLVSQGPSTHSSASSADNGLTSSQEDKAAATRHSHPASLLQALETHSLASIVQGQSPTTVSSPSYDIKVHASKLRPFTPESDTSASGTYQRVYQSKVKPMDDPAEERRGRPYLGHAEVVNRPPSPRLNQELPVPVAKVKPFVNYALTARVSSLGRPLAVSKARPFSLLSSPPLLPWDLKPEPFTVFEDWDDVVAPHVGDGPTTLQTESDLHDATESLSRARIRRGHSISDCDKYPVYAGPRSMPHAISKCQTRLTSEDHQLDAIEQRLDQVPSPPPQANTKTLDRRLSLALPPSKPLSSLRQDSTGLDQSRQSLTENPFQVGPAAPTLQHDVQPLEPNVESSSSLAPAKWSRSDPQAAFAPIPQAKVRPYQLGNEERHVHKPQGPTGMSKVRPANESINETSAQVAHCPIDEEKSLKQSGGQGPSRPQSVSIASSKPSQSLASFLDYRRTSHWLRDVLNCHGTHPKRFTEFPERRYRGNKASLDTSRKSDSIMSHVRSLRRSGGKFKQSPPSDSNSDSYGVRSAVSDLERLLNEALSIAAQVADRPESRACQQYESPSAEPATPSLTGPEGSLDSEGSQSSPFSCNSQEEMVTDLGDLELKEENIPKRPAYQHAATYTVLPRRPRLDDIIKNYSGSGDEMKTTKSSVCHPAQTNLPGTRSRPEIPRRRSSLNKIGFMMKRTADGASGRQREDLRRSGKLGQLRVSESGSFPSRDITLQLRADIGHLAANQDKNSPTLWGRGEQQSTRGAQKGPDSGEERLPNRDLAGRPMRSGRGLSLRRKSHVSLRGAQGFSLAKSRKRQPTARD